MWRRIIVDLFIFFSIFLLPWWVSLLLALSASFYFSHFIEIIFIGGTLDALYGSGFSSFEFPYFFLLGTIVIFYGVQSLKKRLIMYEDV